MEYPEFLALWDWWNESFRHRSELCNDSSLILSYPKPQTVPLSVKEQKKKTMERNPSSVSSQHKSWSLQGQTRLYRSPTSCKVLLLLIAARCTSSSCADHIAKVLTPSPHRAQHLSWSLSCRFHHRPLAYKYNGGWRTAEACVACTRTKVPQHWEEEEKRRKKKRRRKGEATLRLPCCVLYSQWHYLTP